MKRERTSLAWLHVMVLAALVVGMAACIETEPADDQAFLQHVREAAESSTVNAAEVGNVPGTSESPDAVPMIEVGTDYHDLGFIRTDELSKSTIPVKNAGKAPLTISEIRTTCGCTQGTIAQETIPPGGETVINVVVDPKRVYGFESTKTLTVLSNDPKKNAVEIKVHAKIKPEFLLEPETLTFGAVEKGETPTLTAVMRQNTDEPFVLLNAQAQGAVADALGVSFEERPKDQWQDPAKREYAIHVTLKPTAPAGPLAAQVLLQPDLPRIKRHFLRVEGSITAFYAVTPTTANLGLINPGKTVADVLRVSADRPVNLVSATSEPAGLTLTPHPGADGKSVTIDATATEALPLGTYKGAAILVIEGEGKQYTEHIRIVGAVQQPGQLPRAGGALEPVAPAQHEVNPVTPAPVSAAAK